MASAQARHILVETSEAAQDLKTQIENGADFGALAQEHSQCPSGRKGGDLGTFGPGQMVKEFDEVVFSAPLNAVQGPVQTQFGWHVIKVEERRSSAQPTFEAVEAQLREDLSRDAISTVLSDLRAGAEIEIVPQPGGAPESANQ